LQLFSIEKSLHHVLEDTKRVEKLRDKLDYYAYSLNSTGPPIDGCLLSMQTDVDRERKRKMGSEISYMDI
jgi:hypothetical protein